MNRLSKLPQQAICAPYPESRNLRWLPQIHVRGNRYPHRHFDRGAFPESLNPFLARVECIPIIIASPAFPSATAGDLHGKILKLRKNDQDSLAKYRL